MHLLGNKTRAVMSFASENLNNAFSQLGEEYKRCPFCDEAVKQQAKKCKYCGEWFSKGKVSAEQKKKAPKKKINKSKVSKPKSVLPAREQIVDEVADIVTSEIETIMQENSLSSAASRKKLTTNDFALGYLLGYVDGYLQRNKLFETQDIERIAVCTFVFINIFGQKNGAKIFSIAADQQLDNKDIHSGMLIGGEEGFRHIDPSSSNLASDFRKP